MGRNESSKDYLPDLKEDIRKSYTHRGAKPEGKPPTRRPSLEETSPSTRLEPKPSADTVGSERK